MGSSPSRLWTICLPAVGISFIPLAFLWRIFRGQKNSLSADHIAFEEIGHLAGIYIYPVKSCKGISLESSACLIEGLQFDRRWVVVDRDRNYIKSFNKPVLAQVTPHFEDNKKTLCLNAPGMDTLRVNVRLDKEENYVEDLTVYKISSKSQYAGDEASSWFSKLLNTECQMYQVYEPRYSKENPSCRNVALPGDKTGYAAISSYHITTEASLEALNEELPSSVAMDRFRPNIIVGGTKPFAEDDWNHKILKIADVRFRKLMDCGRCVQTTVDSEKGERTNCEPLKTLRRIRLPKDQRGLSHSYSPIFGIHCAPDCEGSIKIGDPVYLSC
ncbi:mitochondrial amidoxime reducing component 2-like isoform X2 [Acropora millepora]|nr:mitochondrial amidoxime reducing component 2-like isoform X2 [Acropora millepora]XP_029205376.2 mitochondrial amidoxime reducing component 2-like isoform X2 [Acropora millepora]